MNDVMKDQFEKLASKVARETEALLNQAIARRLGLESVQCWKFINRMTTVLIPGGNLIYLDHKELISIQIEYHSNGLEIGFKILHRDYEAPNVH